jgi:hypothetical protein
MSVASRGLGIEWDKILVSPEPTNTSSQVRRLVSCNPEGCQKVAGGRSAAQTSGNGLMSSHPEGVPALVLARGNISHPFGVLTIIDRVPVVCDHRLLSGSPSGYPNPAQMSQVCYSRIERPVASG